MRRILFLPFVLLAFFSFNTTEHISAQTVNLFCDDFDSLGVDSFYMVRRTQPASFSDTNFFTKDSVVTKNNSPFSATDTVGNRVTTYLESPWVQVANFDNVGISFDHICYIDQFDEAIVEYTFDGTTWTRLPVDINNNGSIERVYTGGSLYQFPQRAFSKISNPQVWPFLDSMFVFTRNTTAWVTESFNVTPVIDRAGRQNNGIPPDSMRIRLGLNDNPASPVGRTGLHRWWIDNFCIRGSNCELTPPTLILEDPPVNYPGRYEDRVYWVGPYVFDAQITDASQINRAYVEYYLKRDTSAAGNSPLTLLVRDTLDMNFLGFSRYRVFLPRYFTNQITNTLDSILPFDSIYWKIEAVDNSPCFNRTQDPPAGFTSFEVRSNLPKACSTQPEFVFPYYQTFNGPDFIVSESGVLAESWINPQGDFHDWWVASGPPRDFPNTGPSDDHPGGGKYLLLEATGFRDSTAYLLSPCIDLSEVDNTLIRFYLNQNGVGGDTVHLDVFDPTPLPNFPDGRFINDVIPPIGGNKGDNWLPQELGTYPYRGKVIQLRWRATPSAVSEATDIGLDSFKIIPSPVHDLRMDRVEFGPYTPSGILDTAVIRLTNLGALPADSFEIYYEVISNGTVVESKGPIVYNDFVIQPGQNRRLKLNRTIPNDLYTVPLGEFSIKAWVNYFPYDQTRANDTTIANTRGLFYKQLGCSKDFFDNVNNWVGLANDSTTFSNKWELGTPNFGRTNSAWTKPNSWDVLLNRGYAGSGGVEQLITNFYSTQGGDSIILAFFNNRALENTKDGVWLEFSLDRGLTWEYLENLSDSNQRKHWYNSNVSSGGFGGQFVFADTTRNIPNNWNNWVESEIMLPDTLEDRKEILFRFMFFAEEEPGGSAGMSIDNFLVYDQSGVDIEPHVIVRPIDRCDLSATQPFYVVVKNRGAEPVSTFDISYLVDGPTGYQLKSETINRTIPPRDTIHVFSSVDFDLSLFGFYDIAAITSTPGDVCAANDTLWGEVENIDGCSFIFEVVTRNYPDPRSSIDSSMWRFDITNNNKKYVIKSDYRYLEPADTNRQMICIKNGSQVRFILGDRDTVISNYSFIAFDGENDTIFVNQEPGGDVPPKFFDWNCPPERSAKVLDLIILNGNPLPLEGDFNFQVQYENNGLDSINFLEVGIAIDGVVDRRIDTINPPLVGGLQYTRKRVKDFGVKPLTPGVHRMEAWVHDPNGLPDLLPIDDSLAFDFTVIDNGEFKDTTLLDSSGNPIRLEDNIYCTDFEDNADKRWIAIYPYPITANISREQREQSFERSLPATQGLNSTHSGTKAWVTNDTGNYKTLDATSVLSPFFQMNTDSCYKVSFWNNYVIRDQFNDGGHFQMSADSGNTWTTIFYSERDSVTVGDTTLPMNINFQKNWHNANFIKAIPGNNGNSGWTGVSNGWVLSENVLGGGFTPVRYFSPSKNRYVNYRGDYRGIFRLRFESDGSVEDEGWAIDDFCIQKISPVYCGPVGLEEQLAKMRANEIYVGQNVPNPARQTTSIPYYLPKAGRMNVRVTNVMGQLMFSEISNKPQGTGYIDLNILNYAQGVYYYTIEVDGEAITKKMVVTK